MPEKIVETPVQKELHVFFVLDTSASMLDQPITALNDAMRSTVGELNKHDGTNADFFVGVLEFNDNARWIANTRNGERKLTRLKDFTWTNLRAGGMTALGAALKELNTALSRNDKMQSPTGNWAPVVIFMSDGGPTDDWRNGLTLISDNRWYQQAIKIAFALGEHADKAVLEEVVNVGTNPGEVIKTNDLQVFSDLIKLVAVTSSLASSRSKNVNDPVDTKAIVDEAKKAGGYEENDEGEVVQGKLAQIYDMNAPVDDDLFDDLG